MPNPSGWPDWDIERTNKLLELFHRKPKLSARQIAETLGGFEHCSDGGRLAVLGKIHRLRNGKTLPPTTINEDRMRARREAALKREAEKRARREAREAKRKRKVARMLGNGSGFVLVTEYEMTPRKDDLEIPVEQRKTLLELENYHCRFPVGDPCSGEFFFCGDPSADVSGCRPYCAHHMRVTHQPAQPRKRRSEKAFVPAEKRWAA